MNQRQAETVRLAFFRSFTTGKQNLSYLCNRYYTVSKQLFSFFVT